MSLEEIIHWINYPVFNEKCNNYIFTDFLPNDLFCLFSYIEKESVFSKQSYFDEAFFEAQSVLHIPVPLSKITPEQLFMYTFSKIGIEEQLFFEGREDLLRLRGILREYKKVICFLFYSFDISLKRQKKINELLNFPNSYFHSIFLLQKKEILKTYQTASGKMLDPREDYTKISLIR